MVYILSAAVLLVGVAIALVTNWISLRLDREFRVPKWPILVAALVALTLLGGLLSGLIDGEGQSRTATPTAVTTSGTAGGWGPADRPTYTMAHPPKEPVLNSITDNPGHGDERNFVQVRNLTRDSLFGEEVEACSGDLVEVYVGIWNDADLGLDDAGAILGLRMRALVTDRQDSTAIGGVLEATNAATVWDSAYLTCAGRPVSVMYRDGASRLYFDSDDLGGRVLVTNPFEAPSAVGRDQEDGRLPSETGHSWGGYAILQLQVL